MTTRDGIVKWVAGARQTDSWGRYDFGIRRLSTSDSGEGQGIVVSLITGSGEVWETWTLGDPTPRGQLAFAITTPSISSRRLFALRSSDSGTTVVLTEQVHVWKSRWSGLAMLLTGRLQRNAEALLSGLEACAQP